MKKFYLYILLTFFYNVIVNAQNEFDALRYGSIDFYGDARFNAMGGSFGALGANMSALSINPAGLGVYKSSDFAFTPAFNYNYTESNKDGFIVNDGKLNFHFSNIGLVGSFDGNNDWENVNFAFGYNRISNFNNAISIKSSTDSSFLNTYTNELNVNGGTLSSDIPNNFPYSSNLAYQNYLVNPLTTDSMQYDNVYSNSKNITQTTTYETRGGTGEMYFAVGGNYSNKLYIGGLLGIPIVRYVYDRNYTETADPTDTLTNFKSFTVHDYVRTSGAGVNFKLGLIYKINDWLRIGTAFHTPTVYSLSDNYETTVNSEEKSGLKRSEKSPAGNFNYFITTPYRYEASSAVVVGEHGVINADYEVVDYSTSRIKEDNSMGTTGADFSVENQSIRSNFDLAQNFRVGTEWRLDPFRIRAGYRYFGNAFSSNVQTDNSASVYSVGFGIKQDDYYFDMSYSLKTYKSQVSILAEQNDFAPVNLKDHYLTFTLGFRF